jgi:mRNA interferase HigB
LRLISEKPLCVFWGTHEDTEAPLCAWIKVAEEAEWEKFNDVRMVYPHADQVGKFTVINIGGNKYRLVVVIHYNRRKIYVRHILTHAEYDRGTWKND